MGVTSTGTGRKREGTSAAGNVQGPAAPSRTSPEGNIHEGNIHEGNVHEGNVHEGNVHEGNVHEGNATSRLFIRDLSMIQRDLLQTIRELCESAVYFYSRDRIGHAHQLLAQCEQILVQNGFDQASFAKSTRLSLTERSVATRADDDVLLN